MSKKKTKATDKTKATKKKTAAKKKKPTEQNLTLKKATMLESLQKTLGVVSQAAELTGISRAIHYHWLEDDPNYKAAVDDIQNVALDFAESRLHKKIEGLDTTAIIFFLKCKGRGRGYIERQDINNRDLTAEEIFKEKTLEELIDIARG